MVSFLRFVIDDPELLHDEIHVTLDLQMQFQCIIPSRQIHHVFCQLLHSGAEVFTVDFFCDGVHGLLLFCAEHITLDPVLHTTIHPHEGFFDVRERTSILTAGELPTLESTQSVTDDLQQVCVQ